MIALVLLALAFVGAGIVGAAMSLELYRDLKVGYYRWRLRKDLED